jgi:hypothetical protein
VRQVIRSARRVAMSVRTINLKAGLPSVEEARRRLIAETDKARRESVRVLKVIHGWGSSGEGGKLGPAIRRSLRLRVKEGQAALVVIGERFSSDTVEGRELTQRHPSLRKDSDFNRANPGITLVELV